MNVLIVDDDKVDRKLLRKILMDSNANFNDIVDVSSVEEGLEVIANSHFDAILLDYTMPKMDGIEMVIEIRSKPNLGETAIVMISESEELELSLRCIEAGAQDFLTKSEISHGRLGKAILHAKKRFEIERNMHKSYLAVKKMAERDPLTGLSNRYHCEEMLKVMIATNKRSDETSVALLALDIDNFKNINDTLGHDFGDFVLKDVVERISGCLRSNEGFARLGGDEFAIIIGGITAVSEIDLITCRILEQFKEPFGKEAKSINCTISIGAAICPQDAIQSHELMKCADIAMYRSKRNGKNKISFYEARFQEEFNLRARIQNELSFMLKEDRFRLFYQPLYCANTQEIKGFEALMRWPEADIMFTPDEFIPIAEECGLINPLGKWIISTAITQLAHWRKKFNLPLTMSINISPIQLQTTDLFSHLVHNVEQSHLSPDNITLEITETTLFKDSEKISATLRMLSKKGFKIALDDFGMGFSSISHLIEYPINIVKLDKTLQSGSEVSDKRQNILEGLSLMLKKLGFEIVAEGIETNQQKQLCQDLKLDRLQGYLFSKPLPNDDIEKMLA